MPFLCSFFHNWVTVGPMHRHCGRKGCALAQKKVDGKWMNIPLPVKRK